MVIGMFSASCWKIFYGWGTEDLRRVAPGAFGPPCGNLFGREVKTRAHGRNPRMACPCLRYYWTRWRPSDAMVRRRGFACDWVLVTCALIACWRVLILSSFWCVVRRIAYRFRYRKLMRAGCCKLGSWCKLSHVLLFFFFWDHTKGYLLLSQIIDLVQKNI